MAGGRSSFLLGKAAVVGTSPTFGWTRQSSVGRRLGGATHLLRTEQMCCELDEVTSAEFKRWLEKRGCLFEPGKGGHLKVRRAAFLGASDARLQQGDRHRARGENQERPRSQVRRNHVAISRQTGAR